MLAEGVQIDEYTWNIGVDLATRENFTSGEIKVPESQIKIMHNSIKLSRKSAITLKGTFIFQQPKTPCNDQSITNLKASIIPHEKGFIILSEDSCVHVYAHARALIPPNCPTGRSKYYYTGYSDIMAVNLDPGPILAKEGQFLPLDPHQIHIGARLPFKGNG